MGLGRPAGGKPAATQSPAFAERRAVADLGRHAEALFVHRHPKRVSLVEDERIIAGIASRNDGDRFVRRERMSVHVALGKQMLTWSEQFLHCLMPILYRLVIHFYYDMPDQRRTDTFVSKR